jgi:hypothetical protein
MNIQLVQRVREYLGWCPQKAAFRPHQVMEDPASCAQVVAATPDPQTASPGRRDFLYNHTQIGRIQVWASVVAIVIIALSSLYFGTVWTSIAATIFLGGAILLFGSLTVRVSHADLQVRFGPFGIVKKIFLISAIRSVTVVKTPWYYGWGIRWTPDGPLYNIAGNAGIEVILHDGKKFRIGTDEPEALAKAIASGLQ